jgi:hypothetical protein
LDPPPADPGACAKPLLDEPLLDELLLDELLLAAAGLLLEVALTMP